MKPMMYSAGKSIFLWGIIILIPGLLHQCSKSDASRDTGIDPEFSMYVSGFTGGVISTAQPVTIRLTQQVKGELAAGQEITARVFEFEPSIKGKAVWLDERTIEFRPAQRMRQDTEYTVDFLLGKVMEVPVEYEVFSFTFRTIQQNFEIRYDGLQPANMEELRAQEFHGQLITADYAEDKSVEKILSAVQNDNSLPVSWNHMSDGKIHHFIINNITRGENEDFLVITWNGEPLGVTETGEKKITIPSLTDFSIREARVNLYPEQYISIYFSDPIMKDQDLNGLITIDNHTGLDFFVQKNEIQVFPSVKQSGTHEITLHRGIQNLLGYKLDKSTTLSLEFEQVKPAVRLLKNGVILPTSRGLIFPFEAVNLKAVDLQVIRIYEENIPQFLQVNDLKGNNELKRVGYPVIHKIIPLTSSGITDLSKWNRFTLDLSEFFKAEPGAIYQVGLNIKKEHSLYYCGEEIDYSVMEKVIDDSGEWDDYETSYWDYYSYYPNGYEWSERDNPCHISYYNESRALKHNLLVSDLGIIAKLGTQGDMDVFVNDIKTVDPLSGVNLEVYDYQLQLIAEIITDNLGMAELSLEKKPFLLVARLNDQRGYLKLNDGNALSMSNFDTGGESVQSGLKGFIYTERGVWRPGDSLHIAFILEDQNKILPENHPVIFEIFDPMGRLDKKIVKTESVGGIYNFSTYTDVDDHTGNWTGKVSVGGASFEKRLKIETIKPNRLKINLDFGSERLTGEKEELTGQLSVRWLHGAVARNLRAQLEVSLSESKTSFENYQEYIFDDPVRDFSSESKKIYDDYIDENGKANVSTRFQIDNESPGMLMAHFKSRVYEEGGNFSVDRFSIPYYPYESFVGIRVPEGDAARGMLLTDTTHVVRVVSLDPSGKPVDRENLEMEVYKLQWRWWWESTDEYLGNYVGNSYRQPVIRKNLYTKNGRGAANFKIEYPEWGRYLIRVCDPVSGHCTGKIVYIDWPGWAGHAKKDIPGGATMLSFSADKETYAPGEEINLSIPGSAAGRGLVSIENGSNVVETHWINMQKGDNQFTIEAKRSFAPNVYVHVSLLQPHAQTSNDLPIRMYGVINLRVDDPVTHLNPVIDMPDQLKPEKEFTIKISEKDRRAMAYTIAVVDEGLLDLTRFRTPQPWQNFYSKESLGVKTWDLYDDVIGAFGGRLERLLAVGGDDEMARPEGSRANRFEPVVQFLGPFHLEEGKENSHSLIMPRYIGSVRTMVVSAHEGAYGNAEKATPVKEALMVLGTLPRVLGPGEKLNLPVNVFCYDENIKKVKVEVKTNELIKITGGSSREISFREPGDQVIYFPVEVKPGLGIAEFEIAVKSGTHEAFHAIEIDIRNPNTPVTRVYDVTLDPQKGQELSFSVPGMSGTNTALLEVSNIPPIDFGRRLKYLLRYPHGCIEQTVSAAFPQLYLRNIMEVNESLDKMTTSHIRDAINKIYEFQNLDGGFKYWPSNTQSDEWSTTYAGHFLIEARNMGYAVNELLIQNWVRYQKRLANQWKKSNYPRSDLVQAYRLYTLALANEASLGAMNRLKEENRSLQGSWRLSAAYALAGLPEAAEELIDGVTTSVEEYTELSHTYGSNIRDEAMILETLGLLNQKNAGMDLLRKISGYLSNPDYWMSTQTTAYCLIAVAKFIEKEELSGSMQFEYSINNQSAVKAATGRSLIQKDLGIYESRENKINIENKGKGTLFVRLILTGTPMVDPGVKIENNLRMNVVYKDLNGEPVDVTKVRQGTSLIADIMIKNPGLRGDYEEMALSQLFPSGFEIINSRLDDQPDLLQVNIPEYQDIRDDRVYSYFDLKTGESKIFRILLNASYTGRYYMPATRCEAMYDHSISARDPGYWIEIVPVDN